MESVEIHFIDRDIQLGTYSIGSNADAAACEWGRFDHQEGVDDQVVETGGYYAGATLILWVSGASTCLHTRCTDVRSHS